jgi:putative tricarboxylic transport membrane protein
LAFGVPGGSGTALLLAALTLHGIVPGRELMTDGLSLVFVLIWSLFFSNWMTSILGVAVASPLARLTVIRTHLLIPIILVLATLGAFVYRGQVADVVVAVLFAFIGYHMKKLDWPRIPLVIGMVLGPLFEDNLHLTLQLHSLGRTDFWSRPIAMILLVLTLGSLALPHLMRLRTIKQKAGGAL